MSARTLLRCWSISLLRSCSFSLPLSITAANLALPCTLQDRLMPTMLQAGHGIYSMSRLFVRFGCLLL